MSHSNGRNRKKHLRQRKAKHLKAGLRQHLLGFAMDQAAIAKRKRTKTVIYRQSNTFKKRTKLHNDPKRKGNR